MIVVIIYYFLSINVNQAANHSNDSISPSNFPINYPTYYPTVEPTKIFLNNSTAPTYYPTYIPTIESVATNISCSNISCHCSINDNSLLIIIIISAIFSIAINIALISYIFIKQRNQQNTDEIPEMNEPVSLPFKIQENKLTTVSVNEGKASEHSRPSNSVSNSLTLSQVEINAATKFTHLKPVNVNGHSINDHSTEDIPELNSERAGEDTINELLFSSDSCEDLYVENGVENVTLDTNKDTIGFKNTLSGEHSNPVVVTVTAYN